MRKSILCKNFLLPSRGLCVSATPDYSNLLLKKLSKQLDYIDRQLKTPVSNNAMIDRKVKLLSFYERLETIQQLSSGKESVDTAVDLDRLVQGMKEYGLSIPTSTDYAALKDGRRQKKQNKKPIVRLPYRLYRSIDNIYVRVGRNSKDNDMLSMNPLYRNDKHWWLHVNGMAGSHVVICSDDKDLPTKYRETLIDAALLAQIFSSCKSNTSTINYIRHKYVSKYVSDAPGLVRLNSNYVSSIDINRKIYSDREKRLLDSVLPVNMNEMM